METTTRGSLSIVHLPPELDCNEGERLLHWVREALAQDKTRFILDFDQVRYIDSSGIGNVVQVFRLVQNVEGKLVLAQCSEEIQRVFRLVNFQKYFETFVNIEEACDFLQKG